jgi:hypothetical protein
LKLTKSFAIECCDLKASFECEGEATEALMAHIREKHRELLAELEKEARKLAQSQNGRGYYDDGKQPEGGWHDAGETFRNAWIEHALEERLDID